MEAQQFMRAWTHWHLVVGSLTTSAGRLAHLSACHRWNSDEFIHHHRPGLVEAVPPGGHLCDRCDRIASERLRPEPHGQWAAEIATWSGSPRLHLKRSRTWHLAIGNDAIDSPEEGAVYLTECGWYVERQRVSAVHSRPHDQGHSPMCEACVRFAKAHAAE